MKFISWNVNGFRACLKKGFEEFFNLMDADYFKKKSQQQLFFEKIKLIISKNAVKEEPENAEEPAKINVKETYKKYNLICKK